MLKDKRLDLSTNYECQCYQPQANKDTFFLTKKQKFIDLSSQNSFKKLPQHVQTSLGLNSIKQSLKRTHKAKNNLSATVTSTRNAHIEQVNNARDVQLKDARSIDFKKIRYPTENG